MSAWGENFEITIAKEPSPRRQLSRAVYTTSLGSMYCGRSERALRCPRLKERIGTVQLILTSPPFPLKTQKRYGNLEGKAYISWFARFAPLLRDYLTPDGSIVIEIGNAWEPGRPVMSTTVLRGLLRFLEKGGLYLCQEFIWYNNARLPAPAQWVNVERIRVKDAFTRIWWMALTDRPKADNRKIQREYSKIMRKLLETGSYNSGLRPSEYYIGRQSFNKDNGGAIPPNVIDGDSVPTLGSILKANNTRWNDQYQLFCGQRNIQLHPARMPREVAEFFIRFLTDEGDLILDPFAGSNMTGSIAEEYGRQWISVEAQWEHSVHSIGRFNPDRIKATSSELTIEETRQAASASSSTTPLFTS
jgi:site-specific DNA-methyltransferase (cytosine-N4-specific)